MLGTINRLGSVPEIRNILIHLKSRITRASNQDGKVGSSVLSSFHDHIKIITKLQNNYNWESPEL